MEGWIKLHRQMLNWQWYDDANVMRLFIHLLLSANREKAVWRGIEINRGQVFTSVLHLAQKLKISIKETRTALSKLTKTKEIDVQGASNGTMITICKYDSYQLVYEYEGQAEGQTRGKRGATNKKDKEGKEINNNNIELADKKLIEEIKPFIEVYGRQMCLAFYNYWSEKDNSGKKLKYQLQKTWDTGKRLSTWKRNESKYGTQSNQPIQTNSAKLPLYR